VRVRQYIAIFTERLRDAANRPAVRYATRAVGLSTIAECARAKAIRDGVYDAVGLARIEGVAEKRTVD
jgi:hypothetical protein